MSALPFKIVAPDHWQFFHNGQLHAEIRRGEDGTWFILDAFSRLVTKETFPTLEAANAYQHGQMFGIERIIAAAVNVGGLICSLPAPGRHSHIIKAIATATGEFSVYDPQGFVTSKGRFVDRQEAAEIAFAAQQIGEPKAELFSEDVW